MAHNNRPYAIHYGRTLLDKACGSHWARHVAEDLSLVTCRICLYHAGLYVPLTRLLDHQMEQARSHYYAEFNAKLEGIRQALSIRRSQTMARGA